MAYIYRSASYVHKNPRCTYDTYRIKLMYRSAKSIFFVSWSSPYVGNKIIEKNTRSPVKIFTIDEGSNVLV